MPSTAIRHFEYDPGRRLLSVWFEPRGNRYDYSAVPSALVAAFRRAGSDIQTATLQQGLLSDPVDKMVTFFTVYLILNAMARRTKAPPLEGERLLEGGDAGVDDDFDAPAPQEAPA